MGKHMRKAKASSVEVATMVAVAVPPGVCTRARMLTLRKQQMQTQGRQGEGDVVTEYLELRSRKLEKMSWQKASVRRGCRNKRNKMAKDEQAEATLEEVMARRDGEATPPCNLITDSELMIITNRSTKRHSHSTTSHGMPQALVRYTTPSLDKFNKFFTAEMQRDQQAFMEKYNFDPVNDCPLPGHYEWVKLK